jgi:CheY-like chemotaxis protein
VLVVDDHEDSADVIALYLERHGHAVRTASSAREAIQQARDFLPDVAIIDIRLGEESGHDLVRDLKKMPALHGCTLIALTALAFERDREASLAAGFHVHLTKPFDVSALEQAVERGAA